MNNWLVRTSCRTIPEGYDFAVDIIGEDAVKHLFHLATGETKDDAYNNVAEIVGEDAIVEIFDLGPVNHPNALADNMLAVSQMLAA